MYQALRLIYKWLFNSEAPRIPELDQKFLENIQENLRKAEELILKSWKIFPSRETRCRHLLEVLKGKGEKEIQVKEEEEQVQVVVVEVEEEDDLGIPEINDPKPVCKKVISEKKKGKKGKKGKKNGSKVLTYNKIIETRKYHGSDEK